MLKKFLKKFSQNTDRYDKKQVQILLPGLGCVGIDHFRIELHCVFYHFICHRRISVNVYHRDHLLTRLYQRLDSHCIAGLGSTITNGISKIHMFLGDIILRHAGCLAAIHRHAGIKIFIVPASLMGVCDANSVLHLQQYGSRSLHVEIDDCHCETSSQCDCTSSASRNPC